MDPETIQIAIEGAKQAYENGGWFGLAGFLVPIIVGLYRAEKTQTLFEKLGLDWLAWDNQHELVKTGVVAGTSAVASACVVLAAGLGWTAAAWAAAPVMIVAIVTHICGKAVGDAVDGWMKTKNPQYVPGTLRKATTVLVPLSKKVKESG